MIPKQLALCHSLEGVCPARAGKTTLMDTLAGRKTSGHVQGDIFVDGHPKDQATFARVSGYVEQVGCVVVWRGGVSCTHAYVKCHVISSKPSAYASKHACACILVWHAVSPGAVVTVDSCIGCLFAARTWDF